MLEKSKKALGNNIGNKTFMRNGEESSNITN
jgi:hypothetical protein